MLLSETTYATASSNAWSIGFIGGLFSPQNKATISPVKCVRGDQAPPINFKASADGTVIDQRTGLEWQQQSDGIRKNFQGAVSYCEGLSLGNQSDWRLPNAKELESITDDNRLSPAIDPIFTTFNYGVWPYDFWSSTSRPGLFRQGLQFSILNGYAHWNDKENWRPAAANVRCVRGGQ